MKVLIITYYWPPSGGSGVQRWTFFARYLPAFGITPVIVTVKPEDAVYPAYDESLKRHVEGLEVHHTSGGFQLLKAYSILKSGKSGKVVPVGNVGSARPSLFDKLAMKIRANLFVPDARVGWNKQAINKALELTAKHDFDAIITTGPPHSTHLIGLELKKKTGIRWMADFRDPWREIYYSKIFNRSARADKKDARLEAQVLAHADLILTVGPSLQNLLREKLSNSPEKVQYVLNGFDEDMFTGRQKNRYPEFTLAYIGTWTEQQPYTELAAAIRRFLSAHPEQTLRLVLAGKIDKAIIDAFSSIPNLIVEPKGMLPHHEAVQEMLNANLLVNAQPFLGDSKIMITGKLMEYLASGNPVLTIGYADSDAGRIMQEFRNTKLVENGDSEAIYIFLSELTANRDRSENADPPNLRYSRKASTQQLAELLKSLR